MLRWLYRILDQKYGPNGPALHSKDWSGILLELADGYEKHMAVFQAIQIRLRSTERMVFNIPKIKNADDLALWQSEQYGLAREANALRFILRLPIEGQKLIEKSKAAKVKKEEEPEPELD